MALHGTALKPCIQFDDRLKICVGLTDPVNLEFVTKHPQLSSEELKGKFVTEAVPYFLTSMDMKNAMPVAVDYVTKSKNGEQQWFRKYIHCKCAEYAAKMQRATT